MDETVVIPLEDIQVDDLLNYIERLVAILDQRVKNLRSILMIKVLNLVNVKLQHRKGTKWTWEPESEMNEHYPSLFSEANFKGEDLF